MESPINVRRRDLSSADWSRLRPMITELYQNQRLTMDQVRLEMNTAGYRVTTRMVRARITQWDLHRNHQLRDMVAALRLLDLNSDLWPSQEPHFLVRGRLVTMKEIEYYFRRKGVQNPLQWAHSTAVDCNTSRVTLLNNNEWSAGEITRWSERPMQSSGAELPAVPPNHLTGSLVTLDEKAVINLKDYCSAYIKLRNVGHQEPQVHQFTIYGQFGEAMRDGLAHMMRKNPDAFPKFFRGFDLVGNLLSDCHPMALGQYLSVICILASHRAHSILSSLLRYVATMASTLGMSSSAVEFLIAIHSSQDVLGTAILCLRAAVGVFAEQQCPSWQKLYIQERLCDCLYYGKAYTEGSTYRSQLFLEQEMLYGPFARNVLWTLTNVASDHIYGGDITNGQAKYALALVRAENLTGLGRAKIRFAALEGLAQSEQVRFERMYQSPSGVVGELPVLQLQNAFRYIQEALSEAQTSFEHSSRRTLRALEFQAKIVNSLANLGYQPIQNEF